MARAQIIADALANTPNPAAPMGVDEFAGLAIANGIDVDPTAVKYAYKIISGEMTCGMYVTDDIIRWTGYDAGDATARKHSYIQLLRRCEIPDGCHVLSKLEYQEFLRMHVNTPEYVNFPSMHEINNATRGTHIIVSPQCFLLSLLKTTACTGDSMKLRIMAVYELHSIYSDYLLRLRTPPPSIPLSPGHAKK